MSTSVEFPGLIWVKDPVDLQGNVTGFPPRRRHHEICWHFCVNAAGTMVGPPPYRATDEQMRTLPACKTCAETESGASSAAGSPAGQARRGEICAACFIERPLFGACPNCGDE